MAKRNREHQPVNPFHPGEVLLKEFLDAAEISQAACRKAWVDARQTE